MTGCELRTKAGSSSHTVTLLKNTAVPLLRSRNWWREGPVLEVAQAQNDCLNLWVSDLHSDGTQF